MLPDLSHRAWCDADLHKNKNNKDAKSQHLETFAAEVAQLEASIADLELSQRQFAAVPSNSELNAKIEADETAVRKEHGLLNAQTVSDTVARVEASRGGLEGNSRARGFPRCHFFLASRSIAHEIRTRNDSRRGIIDLLEVIEADFT